MDKNTNNKIDKSIRAKVLEFGKLLEEKGLPVSKLILFGSYAKNTANASSDIDVCVVSSEFGKDQMDELQLLWKLRRGVDARIEPFPASLADFNEIESPLMWEIRKHGLLIA